MEPLLQVRKLCQSFRKNGHVHQVLTDIDLDMYPGEALGIVGPSGCGKSTLINIIAGLQEPVSGQVLRRPGLRWHMVFQNPVNSFNPRMKLETSLTEGLRNLGWTKEKALARIVELLGKCGLEETYLKAYPHQLSGGQCQRAAIARALACEPELLICDEITSALDVLTQEQIMELLRNVQADKGMSFLFVSHDAVLVKNFCNRSISLKK